MEKFIKMLQLGSEYGDLICPDLRALLGFLEDPEYLILVKILTGNLYATVEEAARGLGEANIPECYLKVASQELYDTDLKFKVLIDYLSRCEQLRNQVIKDL